MEVSARLAEGSRPFGVNTRQPLFSAESIFLDPLIVLIPKVRLSHFLRFPGLDHLWAISRGLQGSTSWAFCQGGGWGPGGGLDCLAMPPVIESAGFHVPVSRFTCPSLTGSSCIIPVLRELCLQLFKTTPIEKEMLAAVAASAS